MCVWGGGGGGGAGLVVGGRGPVWGDQGGSELRIEVIVKMPKNVGGGGQRRCVKIKIKKKVVGGQVEGMWGHGGCE